MGVWLGHSPAVGASVGEAPRSVPGAELFSRHAIPRLQLRIADDDLATLRREPRKDVPAEVREGGTTFNRVAVHLKGGTGSFRGIDDKPSLTLNFGKLVSGQRFHGLRKLHLNNSVEDPSFFHELAGTELFRAAGVPAPRVTQALVELNGRPLGLYVLKEGFAREFLGLQFSRTTGNLYDIGPGHDVDEPLQRDQGEGPDDRRDLLALAAAAREPDLAKRWPALAGALDVERFLSFMAVEILAGHRDGYSLARNNFRIYHDPETDRLVFLPHGMDQLFGRADAPIRPSLAGLVARAVMETPEGRRLYHARLAWLVTNAFDVPALHRKADALLQRARPLLTPREAGALAQALAAAKERIAARKHSLEGQLGEPDPTPLRFDNGVAALTQWQVVDAPAGGTMDRLPAPDGRPALHIRAGPMTAAAWRARVLLPMGRYRFETAVFTKGVMPLAFGKSQGAGLRVVCGMEAPPYRLVGDNAWAPLERTFELAAEAEVQLLCELRASAGEAWFDAGALRLVKLP